jgi:hypothetical protein
MSDRTPGSVRNASPAGDGAAPKDSGTGAPPATATQSIPGTGTQRAQEPAGSAQGRPDDAGLSVTGSREAADTGATGTPTTTAGDPARAAGKSGAERPLLGRPAPRRSAPGRRAAVPCAARARRPVADRGGLASSSATSTPGRR